MDEQLVAVAWWRQRPLQLAAVLVLTGLALLANQFWWVPLEQDAELDSLSLQPELAPLAEVAPSSLPALVVYISGAVHAPGVYELSAGARAADAVRAAGGLLPEADAVALNLAATLADAAHLHVPRLGEAAVEAAGPLEAGSGLLDLNSASAAELDALPGIGPAIAERIIAYRETEGLFTAVEDLQQVRGIGPALFEQIAPLVSVGQ